MLDAQIHKLAVAVDTATVENLEFCLLKRRCHLVFNDLNAGFVTYNLVAILYGSNTTNIQTYRGIKLQGITASGGLRITKHNTNFHTDLVDKDN